MGKLKEKDVIDFGSWTIPSSWNELSLGMFSKIEEYYADKDKEFDVRDVLELFTDHSREEIDQLPIEFVERLLGQLEWIKEAPSWGEPSNKITIDGVEYKVNIMEKLKFGEWVTIDGLLKNDKHNYSAMLAVICRKDGEVYDSKYEAEVFDDRVAMWEKVPVVKVMPIVQFFFQLSTLLLTHSHLYTAVEEALDLCAKDIEASRKIGVCKKYFLKWRMKRLRKSLKSNKYTSQMRSQCSLISFKKAKRKKSKTNTKTK